MNEETNHCPSLEGIINEGKCSESYSGLGSKVYIGVKNEDGSLPAMEDMQEINVSTDRTLFNSDDKDKDGGYSVTGTWTFRKSEEEKARDKKDNILLADISKQVQYYMHRVNAGIRWNKIHGRKRKALLRHLLRYLQSKKRIVTSMSDIWFKTLVLSNIDQAIVNTRLKMGKATRCTLAMKVDGDYIPVEVVGKVVKGKFTIQDIKAYKSIGKKQKRKLKYQTD